VSGVLTQVSYGEEVPDVVDTTGGTVSGNTVSGLSGLTANKYVGQMAIVLDGSDAGSVYHVASNTASSITFEETPGFSAGARIAITTEGQLPSDTTKFFGIIDESDIPSRAAELFDEIYHGGDLPLRSDAVPMKFSYESTIALSALKNAEYLWLALGKVTDTPSAYGAVSTTLAAAAYPGENVVTVSDATGLSVNDYIHIAGSHGGEIRKITAINSNELTLDVPLRIAHAAGVDVKEVDTSGYYTHVITVDEEVPSFTLEVVYMGARDMSDADIVLHTTGLKVKSLELSSAAGDTPLTASLGVAGLHQLENARSKATVVKVGYSERPYLFKDSSVTINGVVYSRVEDFKIALDRELATKWYHRSDIANAEDIDPVEHIEGRVGLTTDLTIPMTNTTLYNLLKNGTKFTATVVLTRGTNDSMTIEFSGCYMTTHPLALPKEGELPVAISASASSVTITVVDSVPHY